MFVMQKIIDQNMGFEQRKIQRLICNFSGVYPLFFKEFGSLIWQFMTKSKKPEK